MGRLGSKRMGHWRMSNTTWKAWKLLEAAGVTSVALSFIEPWDPRLHTSSTSGKIIEVTSDPS